MTNLDKSWTQHKKPDMGEKLHDAFKTEEPLKPRIQVAVTKLQVQINKMDSMLGKMRSRDAQLFQKIVKAMKNHDTQTSKILSNELAEIRKVSKMIAHFRISLEQVQLRLTTIHDMGDAMVSIGPAMSTMKSLRSSLGKFMPEADSELNSMTQVLNELMTDSLAGESYSAESDPAGEDIDNILSEASAVAEQQIGDKFPSAPAQTSTGIRSGPNYE